MTIARSTAKTKQKRLRTVPAHRARTTQSRAPRSARVSSLTIDEFRKMMREIIDERLAELTDPDLGLVLRPEIAESLLRQEREFAAGKRGKPLAEVAQRLGLD